MGRVGSLELADVSCEDATLSRVSFAGLSISKGRYKGGIAERRGDGGE